MYLSVRLTGIEWVFLTYIERKIMCGKPCFQIDHKTSHVGFKLTWSLYIFCACHLSIKFPPKPFIGNALQDRLANLLTRSIQGQSYIGRSSEELRQARTPIRSTWRYVMWYDPWWVANIGTEISYTCIDVADNRADTISCTMGCTPIGIVYPHHYYKHNHCQHYHLLIINGRRGSNSSIIIISIFISIILLSVFCLWYF